MSTRAYARTRDDFLDMACRIAASSIPCSFDDLIDFGNVLLSVFQTHEITFTFPTQPARSYYMTLSDTSHDTHFLAGGSIDIALANYPHLDVKALGQNSWSRSVDVLKEGAGVRKFSYLSCVGAFEYSIRAQDIMEQADADGKTPEFVWILGHQTSDPVNRLRLPVYMSPYLATTFVSKFKSLSSKDKAITFYTKPAPGAIAQQLNSAIAYTSSRAHRRSIKVILYLSDQVPNARPISHIRNAFCHLNPTATSSIRLYDNSLHVLKIPEMLQELKVAVVLIDTNAVHSTSTTSISGGKKNQVNSSSRTTKKAVKNDEAWDSRGVKRQQEIQGGPSSAKIAKGGTKRLRDMPSGSGSSKVPLTPQTTTNLENVGSSTKRKAKASDSKDDQ